MPGVRLHMLGAIRIRRAFTLIETALATVIIGVGVLAIIEAQQAFLNKNSWSTQSATAMFLANEIREMTRNMPRHDPFSGGIYFEDPDAHIGFQGWGPEPDELSVNDFTDLDDFDGVAFGNAPAGDLPGVRTMQFEGPINAFGEVIPEMSWDGALMVDQDGNPLSLRGWTQFVLVEKVDTQDFTVVVPDDFFEPAFGATPERRVNSYPLRVTVFVFFQGPFDTNASLVTRVSWIVPELI